MPGRSVALAKGPALSLHRTYVAECADGARAEFFDDLAGAKAWIRVHGGTIRYGNHAGAPARCDEPHWCQGCDEVVHGTWMAWRDGLWRCAECRGVWKAVV